MPSNTGSTQLKFFKPNKHGLFDFNKLDSFADNYLSTYYGGHPTIDEQIVLDFLVKEFRKIKNISSLIEIGCGPTIHHILPLAKYVQSITMADYLDENLQRIKRWKYSHPLAHKWDKFTALVLDSEGEPIDANAIEKRETEVREKIKNFLPCDLKKARPLGSCKETFDVVACFYCTEEVGVNYLQWVNVMQNLCSIVASGGYLIMAALRETSHYSVIGLDGVHSKLPCAFLNEKDFEKILPILGFNTSETFIVGEKIIGQENEGVNGIILVKARKK